MVYEKKIYLVFLMSVKVVVKKNGTTDALIV